MNTKQLYVPILWTWPYPVQEHKSCNNDDVPGTLALSLWQVKLTPGHWYIGHSDRPAGHLFVPVPRAAHSRICGCRGNIYAFGDVAVKELGEKPVQTIKFPPLLDHYQSGHEWRKTNVGHLDPRLPLLCMSRIGGCSDNEELKIVLAFI